jgi:hypothetical protein
MSQTRWRSLSARSVVELLLIGDGQRGLSLDLFGVVVASGRLDHRRRPGAIGELFR